MLTFSHNHKDDTYLERDGDTIRYAFIGNVFIPEENDQMDFQMTQDELFIKLGEYFDNNMHTEIFDNLTIPAQDALWNALYRMNEQNVKL